MSGDEEEEFQPNSLARSVEILNERFREEQSCRRSDPWCDFPPRLKAEVEALKHSLEIANTRFDKNQKHDHLDKNKERDAARFAITSLKRFVLSLGGFSSADVRLLTRLEAAMWDLDEGIKKTEILERAEYKGGRNKPAMHRVILLNACVAIDLLQDGEEQELPQAAAKVARAIGGKFNSRQILNFRKNLQRKLDPQDGGSHNGDSEARSEEFHSYQNLLKNHRATRDAMTDSSRSGYARSFLSQIGDL